MRLVFSTILLIFALVSTGQVPVGTWSDHLTYNTSWSIAVSENEIFSSTGSSILVYNRSLSELRKLSKVNGLSETGINAIAWSEKVNALIIAYTSTNVDILINNTIYNIPDIERKNIPGEKSIYKIRTSGKYAYLACSFGIVVIDLEKKEIYDTWKPGAATGDTRVYDIAFGNNSVFAATDKGFYSGLLSNQGLSYFGNWNIVSALPSPAGRYTATIYAGGKLYANLSDPFNSGDYVYVIDGGASLFSFNAGIYNNSFELSSSGFTISSSQAVKYYDLSGNLIKELSSYNAGIPNIAQAIESEGDIWIADKSNGLIRCENMTAISKLVLPGPVSNNAYSIVSSDGKTIITGGGTTASWNNQWKKLQISTHEGNSWNNITSTTVSDPLKAVIDPLDKDHFFVSTWGGGLLEYRDNELIKQYTDANSPLQTIIAGQPYVRICGLAMDDDRNLWVTQTEVRGNIKVLKPDGTWFYNPDLNINALTIGDIIIDNKGFKWVVLPRGYGLFVLDDNNTPENFSDDRTRKMYVEDNEGRVAANVYSLASDLDGNIWVGTDQGPFIYFGSERVFEENYHASRIKIPRNDGTNLADFMLGTETITSIAIDGANRKWIGTEESGAYLLTADGTKQLASFNEKNSPILSNYITSITVDNKTGEVWFATRNGIQSYRGNAIEGMDAFSEVYAFPNPVREDFTGNVTITGLVRDTEVKITDISGNLVYSTTSDGGMATWDMKNFRGARVATGVYLAFCSVPGTKEAKVVKILVFR
ncbi:MAG TPA: hypothetical protein VHO50_07410 [Bacteroidales bacterium]|nr:hypothetical protein [Bacteroidales bacterium]